jgi:RNA polymerase sigma-54 factor
MLKQNLSQRMLQKLSPQQIQLMKLLQIPTATLDQRIQEELESNPALDEGEEFEEVFDIDEGFGDDKEKEEEPVELDDYLQEYIDEDPISYKLKTESYSTEEDKTIPVTVQQSFHDHLSNQIGMLDFATDEDETIAHQIIGSIDEDGYLRREPSSIVDDLMFSQNLIVEKDDITRILKRIQMIDPPGVGSTNLQECLLNQLYAKQEKADEANPIIDNAIKILEKSFNEFTKKHYTKLQKSLNLSESDLRDAIDEILKLNPKPASGYTSSSYNSTNSIQYIMPDFIIVNREGELELSLNNRNAPDLRINDGYMDMLKSYKDTTKGRRSTKKEKEAIMFIKQKIDSAKWFIDAIKQRQQTLYNTMYTIMQFQYEFFRTGDERKLKPMILKDIAEITSLDISTISRVANSKFVQTEYGTKRLKDFFSESLQTQDGQEVSTFEVKNILKDLIAEENKRKPLSDEKLKDFLMKKGYNIARRTVAKYREQLNIPVARLRKQL